MPPGRNKFGTSPVNSLASLKDPSKNKLRKLTKPRAKKVSEKDPIGKIIRVNKKSYKFTNRMNALLLKILERYDLDKPILMQDKLDIIWDKNEEKQTAASLQSGKRTEDNVNQYAVKFKLGKRKVLRANINVNQ